MATKVSEQKNAKDQVRDKTKSQSSTSVLELLKTAPASPVPLKIKPMKATLVDEPFNDPGWVYEVKWDGYRAIAIMGNKEVQLVSRNSLPFDQFYPITNC